jgi:hypothetical protein
MQLVWQHQRMQRGKFRTLDGAPLAVLHPGFWNREAGPDFRGAVLRFGDGAPVTGDVEVDREAGGWKAHGHAGNPAFGKVILHVVWEAGAGAGLASKLPTLAMGRFLDAPMEDLMEWAKVSGTPWPEEWRGQCCAPLRSLPAEALNSLLEQAARARLERKGKALGNRAKEAGWEQALREGLFRGLGYKKNAWPMQCVAEILARIELPPGSALVWQARLLGVGGLLPEEVAGHTETARRYLKQVWDHWWRERELFDGMVLPRQVWVYHGQRPGNHPQRRLALAAHWLAAEGLKEALDKWFEKADSAGSKGKFARELMEVLQGRTDAFWSRHWTLRAKPLPKAQPLLGLDRTGDLAMNTLLPWFWMRGAARQKPEEVAKAEALYLAWPKGEDNAVLKLARERLLGTGSDREFGTAASQQGLLQIVGDFCTQAGSLCAECRFPELARQAANEADAGGE